MLETIFLACFLFGALFIVASAVLGAGHGLHIGHVHLGEGGHVGGHGAHLGGHGAHLGYGAHAGHGAHLGHGAHAGHGAHDGHVHAPQRGDGLPLFSLSSALGGLTWFGAAGYLLIRLGDWAVPAVLLGALLAGGVGWYLVARFLGLVLSGEREMDPADYRLEGTVGQVTVGIPAGGTGEVVFSKVGLRRSESARALAGAPIARGTEVVITEYANGFATVQPWGEFLAARERVAAEHKRGKQEA